MLIRESEMVVIEDNVEHTNRPVCSFLRRPSVTALSCHGSIHCDVSPHDEISNLRCSYALAFQTLFFIADDLSTKVWDILSLTKMIRYFVHLIHSAAALLSSATANGLIKVRAADKTDGLPPTRREGAG
jgi:hypothetical protein